MTGSSMTGRTGSFALAVDTPVPLSRGAAGPGVCESRRLAAWFLVEVAGR